MTISPRVHILNRLDYYYKVINQTIIKKQNASSGLMPASTAITVSTQCTLFKSAFDAYTISLESR